MRRVHPVLYYVYQLSVCCRMKEKWNMNSRSITNTKSVPPTKQSFTALVKKTNLLIPYSKIIAVCPKTHNHSVSLCGGLPPFFHKPLKPNGYYTYHQFNIQQFYVLPTQCIYVFCVDLKTNSEYVPIQH